MRALIVDDELDTREGLKEFLPWGEFGVHTVDLVSDGMEALAFCRDTPPDIIISDIRMPRMDGIAFIKQVRTLAPNAKVVMMSAYTDKQYLKSAIEFKAVSYVEKPINLKEMTEAVREAAEIIQKERDVRTLLKGGTEQTQRIALELAEHAESIAPIKKELETILPEFLACPHYCSVVVRTAAKFGTGSVSEALRRVFAEFFPAFLIVRLEQNILAVHLCDKRLTSGASLPRLFHRVIELCAKERLLSNGVFLAVGSLVNGLENLWKSHRRAIATASGFFFCGYGHVLIHDERTPKVIINNPVDRFESCLRLGEREEALAVLNTLAQQVSRRQNLDVDNVRNICLQLAMRVPTVGEMRSLPEDKIENRDDIWKTVAEKETFSEIYDALLKSTENFFAALERLFIRKPVYRVMVYIEQNYTKRSLTLNEIAQSIHLTPAYICHLFKKETGATINQYLNAYRIEQSRNLLRDHQLKLMDVAARVGYGDSNYYMRTFKKITGLTPSEYREKYLLT